MEIIAKLKCFGVTICKTVRLMLSDHCPVCHVLSCPVCLSVCDGVLWSNGWMDQDETWHAGRPRSWPDSHLPPKGAQPPIFGPWPNGCVQQDTTWYGGRPQPRWRIRWGSSSPSPKEAHPPIFGPCPLWPNGSMD